MSDDEVLHESGWLRVDRERALEKLSQFALPSPDLFLLPWARAAAAQGAASLEASGGRDLELAFDGSPFSETELKDPYAALIAGGGTGPRQLGLGLLACLATKPESIAIESGPPERRVLLTVRSLREESLEEAPKGGAGTRIRVRWGAFGPSGAAKRALGRSLDMAPQGFRVDGVSHALDGQGPLWQAASGEGRRILLRPFDGTLSEVTFSQFGVRVCADPADLGLAPVRAWVDDPALALDASQCGVVRDAARDAALAAAAAACRELAARALRGPRPPELDAWLREAAARVAARGSDEESDRRLAEEPLWTDLGGAALSALALREEVASSGRLLWSAEPWKGGTPRLRIVHCPKGLGSAALSLFGGRAAVDVTHLLARL